MVRDEKKWKHINCSTKTRKGKKKEERSTIKSYYHSKYYPKINKHFKCKWFKYIN